MTKAEQLAVTIYTASKTKHASKWLELRAKGYNIISTWIDEWEQGATQDFKDLAIRCINEPREADVTILYVENGDFLKFALTEVGSALSANKKVIIVGDCDSISSTMVFHPNISRTDKIETALEIIKGYNLRDQSAQSDMVKFAEWCLLMAWVEANTKKVMGGMFIIEHNNYDGVYTLEGVKEVWMRDFANYTTTDLLKIFNELNG